MGYCSLCSRCGPRGFREASNGTADFISLCDPHCNEPVKWHKKRNWGTETLVAISVDFPNIIFQIIFRSFFFFCVFYFFSWAKNYGSNLKINYKKYIKLFFFHLKIDFYRYKYIYWIWDKIYSDRSEIDLSD